jgi:hypothetical protein
MSRHAADDLTENEREGGWDAVMKLCRDMAQEHRLEYPRLPASGEPVV